MSSNGTWKLKQMFLVLKLINIYCQMLKANSFKRGKWQSLLTIFVLEIKRGKWQSFSSNLFLFLKRGKWQFCYSYQVFISREKYHWSEMHRLLSFLLMIEGQKDPENWTKKSLFKCGINVFIKMHHRIDNDLANNILK